MKEEPRIGYVCKIAWDHELGETDVTVYLTVELLKKVHNLNCGVVKVRVSFVGLIEEAKL